MDRWRRRAAHRNGRLFLLKNRLVGQEHPDFTPTVEEKGYGSNPNYISKYTRIKRRKMIFGCGVNITGLIRMFSLP